MWTAQPLARCPIPAKARWPLTEHISPLVLAATLLSNIRLDSEVGERQVLNRVGGGVDAPNDAKTLARVDITTELLELGAERRKREAGRLDEVSVLTKSCAES
jgi:hypothetical protein